MSHNYSCPHECEACKKKNHWNVKAWKNNGCLVCGEFRGGTAYACANCWVNLKAEEQQEAMAEVDNVVV